MAKALPINNETQFNQLIEWVFNLPHCKTLGLEFFEHRDRHIVIKLPYQKHLIGDLKTGVIHGGAITTMIDTASSLAVFAQLPTIKTIATLDLRIDYLRPATPHLPIYCKAECYRLSRHIGFTRATAYQSDNSDPIAYGVGTFMRSSSTTIIKLESNHVQ